MLQAALDTGSLLLFQRCWTVFDAADVVDCVLEENNVPAILRVFHAGGCLGGFFLDQEVVGAHLLLLLLPRFSTSLLLLLG